MLILPVLNTLKGISCDDVWMAACARQAADFWLNLEKMKASVKKKAVNSESHSPLSQKSR
jgi:hypothetical protein